jgi:hypothetical protein
MSQDDKFDAKFNYLIDTVEKSTDDDSKLQTHIDKEIKLLSNQLSKKIQTGCQDFLDKVYLYSDKPKNIKSIDDLKPTEGYEVDFKNAINEYKKCSSNYKFILDKLSYDIETINIIGIHSYQICLDQCKSEVKEHKLTEVDAKKCISTCYGYKRMNANAAYDLIVENIDNTNDFLNKI